MGRAGLARIRCWTTVGVPRGLESRGLLGRADGALAWRTGGFALMAQSERGHF